MTTTAPAIDSALASDVRAFCLRGFEPPTAAVRQAFPRSEVWQGLVSTGTAPWLDTGDIEAAKELWTHEFVALTTNNTLLNAEVQKGLYDDLVPEAAKLIRNVEPEIDEALLVQEIAFVLNAVHGLKLVSTFDADVSVELHTNVARDAEASYRYGKRFAAISPDRFIVKVPLTPEGLIAARRLSDDGIRVNFTLGFSARQNLLIGKLAQPRWVNVFMGRDGGFVKAAGLGDGENIGEKATLASQRLVRELRATGIDVYQIGASMRNGDQAIQLMGLDVYTMPTGVAKAYLEAAPSGDEVHARTDQDPPVTPAAGVDFAAEKIDRLWTVPAETRAGIEALAGQDLTALTGDDIRRTLAEHGAQDLFPELSEADREKIMAAGKLPEYQPWADQVRAGTASWDGLLTEAALLAFTKDQTALDDRIRSFL